MKIPILRVCKTNQILPRQIPPIRLSLKFNLSPAKNFIPFLTPPATMASSISRPWQAAEPRSGVRIIRSRRTAGPKTPYDRPQSPPNSSPNPQNPNWLSRLIYSPSRMIATGAGKLFSSVFTNDSSSSSSSDTDSEDDNDNDNDAIDSMKKNGTLEIIEHIRSEPQYIVDKSFETKSLIEQLLMQVTFSREECDRLSSIIKSRVDNGPIIGDTGDRRLTELCNRTIGVDVDMPDHCSAAVMTAKRWLEEKELGSSPKSELELGICTLNSAMSPHVTEGEFGSPIDMAKSYMLTRPPWASPSVNHIEHRSPSPTGIQLFKEETPYSTGYTSFMSSKMKKDSPASGSWNILEEIRNLRSKATEEMLRAPPSSKIDWSSFALENKNVINHLVPDEAETSLRDKVHSSTKPVAASVNVVTGVSTSYDFPVTQVTQDMLQKEAVTPNPVAAVVSEQNQALEDNQTVKETTGLRFVLALNAFPDSGLNKENCSTSKEVAGKSGSFADNGFPTSGSSLSPGQDREQNSRPSNENQNPVASGHDDVPPSVPTGEVCEFFSEASVDVPVMYKNDSIATGSQNSSSMRKEGLSQVLTTPNSKRTKTTGTAEKQQGKNSSSMRNEGLSQDLTTRNSKRTKITGTAEKQQGKKLSRYSRKGRGRGK